MASGGNNVLSNLVRLCNGCHSKAHGGTRLIEIGTASSNKAVKSGRARRGITPYGYRVEGKKYVIDEDQAEVVRYAFRLRYLCEYSTPNIAVILNNMAIPAPKGGLWSHVTVMKLLDNPIHEGNAVYLGENHGNIYPAIIDAQMTQRVAYFNEKYRDVRVSARKVPQLY